MYFINNIVVFHYLYGMRCRHVILRKKAKLIFLSLPPCPNFIIHPIYWIIEEKIVQTQIEANEICWWL